MAIRINNAQNFAGEKYITLPELQSAISSVNASALQFKIEKLAEATSGYAASYQLMKKAGSDPDFSAVTGSVTIDIVKDQFIKSAAFGWANTNTSEPTAWNADKAQISGTAYPCIKIEVWTNEDGDTSSSDQTPTPIYVPLADVFQEMTDGNAIEITNGNTINVKIETATDALKVYTAAHTQTDLIAATASGLVVADVQAAIDTAVADEHAMMSAAVRAVENNVDTLQANTSTAVAGLNTRIEAVASNAQTAATALEGEIVALDSKVDAAFTSADANLSAAVAGVQTSVTNRTANAVQMLESAVTPSNGGEGGLYSATINANNVVAVYGASGDEIYPEITRTAVAGSAGAYNYTLEADYGSAQGTVEQWTVLYTLPLAAYAAVTAGTVSYDVTGSAAKTVGSGTAATAPTAPSAVTVGGLTYNTPANNG